MTLPFENDTSRIVKKLANRSIQADSRCNLFINLQRQSKLPAQAEYFSTS